MSLPRELLDELLSGYMDGELSTDERARVEQMLATDSAVREQLRVMREQSQAVRETIRATAGPDADFARRVLAATFAEAARTGVGEAHPVRLAAADQSRSFRPRPFRQVSRRRWSAIGGLAIAASLVAAVVLLRNGEGETPRVVTTDPAAEEPVEDRPTAAPQPREDAAANIAASQNGAGGRGGSADLPHAERRANSQAASPGPENLAADEPSGAGRRAAASAPENAARASADTAELAVDDPLAPPLAEGQAALRAVLVYQVQVTPLGREQGVINRVFREAEIRVANQREVDDALVGYLQSSGVIGGEANEQAADNDRVSVMFLEGSGRQLERLMLSLLLADEEIRSVGFSLAMDPPVMAAIDTLEQVNAREIRGDTSGVIARSLIPADDSERRGASAKFTAGDRPFMPLGRDSLAGLSTASGLAAEGEADITARTLLVIRFD